jgi:hypothetical protein
MAADAPARTLPRTLSSGLLNGARLRAPIAERLSKFYLDDPDF